MPTQTKSAKPQTPFPAQPFWLWNYVPVCGVPTRKRCQSIVTEAECKTGVELVAKYREWEVIADANDIAKRERVYGNIGRLGNDDPVLRESLRREMAACDHQKWLEAQDKLTALREEAFQLMQPILQRLVKSLDDELTTSALAAEQRLDAGGFPVRNPDGSFVLHQDVICVALWSCRFKAEKTLAAFHPNSAVGVAQHFLTSEENIPQLSWL